ncbi:MAG: DUF4760 domain-containing protein [Moraxella sp.]|nr:DUF4760 domain-containing protein [Moraxella sp.]
MFLSWLTFFVLAATAVVAIITLKSNENRARKRATIDVVLSENQDERFRDIKEKFALMRENNENFTLLACLVGDTEQQKQVIADKKEVIIAILNQYEFIASAIFENALDEELYKRMKKGVLIRDWLVLEPFVAELRKQTGRKQLFCEMQALAQKWQHQ